MKTFKRILTESEAVDLQLRKLGLKRTNKFDHVGKEIGGNIYCHKQYENQFPADGLAAAKAKLPPDFEYDVVKYDPKSQSFSFMKSGDWDTNPEPSVDGGYTVKQDAPAKAFTGAGWIYHHKWMFVDDGYTGFDVEENKLRTLKWSAITGIDKARIGQRAFWDANVIPLINKVQEQTMKPFKKILSESIDGVTSSDVDDIRTREGIKFTTDNGHPTQRSNTVATYRKFFEMLPEELQAGEGLDYSAGLGMGSDMIRSTYGANIESYEPFPHRNSKDITYAGLGSLPDKEYDYIFCSAVLNVVERDIRDQIVLDIWKHLKEGGQAIIGVRSRADVMGTKTAYVINAETGEVLDRSRGSYQKGFTRPELREYIQSLIPDAAATAVDIGGMSQVVIRIYKDVDYSHVTDSVDGGIKPKEHLFAKALRGEDY